MSEPGINRLIEAIARLETKMDTVISRLERGEERFAAMEERLRRLEQTDARMIGIGSAVMIIVPILITFLANALLRTLFP